MHHPDINYQLARMHQDDLLREAAEDRLARELTGARPRRFPSRRLAAAIRFLTRARVGDAPAPTAPQSVAAHD